MALGAWMVLGWVCHYTDATWLSIFYLTPKKEAAFLSLCSGFVVGTCVHRCVGDFSLVTSPIFNLSDHKKKGFPSFFIF
jgi:hypothetical protein